MKKIIFLFIVMHLSLSAWSKELSNAERMKKLSYILNGESPGEITSNVNLNDEKNFDIVYQEKITQYLSDEKFTSTMKDHVLNLFQMYVSYEEDRNQNGGFRNNNSFDNLVTRVISENRSWRELITANEFEISGSTADVFSVGADILFYQMVFYQELSPYLQNYVEQESFQSYNPVLENTKIPLAPKEETQAQSLAGIITTQRFFNRYSTTKVNKNRGRAAALFRIFLCDPMKPIVLSDDTEDKSLLEKALNSNQAHSSNSQVSTDVEAKHGSDAQCMACHYKLDPMAKVFSGSSFILNPFSQSGKLVFKNSNNVKVEESFVGFSGLAKAIVNQDDYRSCQVEHFWDWIIGEDVPLDPEIKKEVVDKFIELDEKPKDFVKYLVNRTEFYSYKPLVEEDITYSHVKPIFKKCDSCHSGDILAPSLSEAYPFDGYFESMLPHSLVEQVALETDLLNRGAKATMPLKKAGWKLNSSERDLILAWIKNGAKDDKGKIQISNGPVFDQLTNIEYEHGFKSELEPTYYPTFSRIVVGNSLVNTLSQKFNLYQNYKCNIDQNDRNSIGFPVAINGKPLFKNITPNYLRWWMNCLKSKKYEITNFYRGYKIPQDIIEKFEIKQDYNIVKWTELSQIQKDGLVVATEFHLLGRGILSEESRTKIRQKIDENLNRNSESLSSIDAMFEIATTYMSTRAFLTY